MSSREQKKSATRTLLIDAAARLFARRGVEGTTMDQIADLAGTSRTSVFNYFGYKEMILSEIGRRLLEEVVSATLARPRRSARATAMTLADAIADIAVRHPVVMAGIARELTHPDLGRRQAAVKRTGFPMLTGLVVDQLAATQVLRHPGERASYQRQLTDLIAGPLVRAGGEFPIRRLRTELRRSVDLFLEGATVPSGAAAQRRTMVAIPVAPSSPATPITRARQPTGTA